MFAPKGQADKPVLMVQVMGRRCQPTNHYLSHGWPMFMASYGIARVLFQTKDAVFIGIPIVKIRRSSDRLTFMIGFSINGKLLYWNKTHAKTN